MFITGKPSKYDKFYGLTKKWTTIRKPFGFFSYSHKKWFETHDTNFSG